MMNLFELTKERFKFTHKPIKLFEAFAGIGTQAMALKRLGIDYETVGISEIDKFAITSYNAIHGKTKNYGDISKIKGKDLPHIDIFTWSFPCTDLSKAGKQKGLENTRSGLGYEVIRIINEMPIKPQVLLMENVPDLLSQKFKLGWHDMFQEIENMGYSNYVEVLNAKNYGVAQNRDRVFMISVLGDWYYEFPKKIKLEKRLKDYLEDDVDEKYYLSDKMLKGMQETNFNTYSLENKLQEQDGVSATILARFEGAPQVIAIPEATKKGYALAKDGDGVYINRPHQKRGVVQKDMIQTLKTSGDDVGVVVKNKNLKEQLCDDLIDSGILNGGEIINHSYTNSKERPELKDFIETKDGVVPTLHTRPDILGVVVKSNFTETEIKMITEDGNIKRYLDSDIVDTFEEGDCADISFPNGYNKANRVYKGYAPAMNNTTIKSFITKVKDKAQQPQIIDDLYENRPSRVYEETSPTLRADRQGLKVLNNLRIRKLSPREVWRLMGISDIDFDKASQVVSNSQLYKQAGNAIVVDVLVEIFRGLF